MFVNRYLLVGMHKSNFIFWLETFKTTKLRPKDGLQYDVCGFFFYSSDFPMATASGSIFFFGAAAVPSGLPTGYYR